jgi:hypothetical protein
MKLDVESFNLEELDGMTLKILVSKNRSIDKDKQAICIFGFDSETNKLYLLHSEIR